MITIFYHDVNTNLHFSAKSKNPLAYDTCENNACPDSVLSNLPLLMDDKMIKLITFGLPTFLKRKIIRQI